MKAQNGFTLIELMIVVAIIGILAAVAFPSYQDSVRKGRRADAQTGLMRVQLAQEKWRANNNTYGTLANIGVASASPDGYYTISVTSPTATGYTASAAPVSTGPQASDTCETLSITVSNGNSTYGSTGGTASKCWGK